MSKILTNNIKKDIIDLYLYYNTIKDIKYSQLLNKQEFINNYKTKNKNRIKKIKHNLFNLKLNDNEKDILINLLIEFKINKLNTYLYDNLLNFYDITYIKYDSIYNKYVHQYLYDKINNLNNNKINEIINEYNIDDNIKDEIFKIDEIINNSNFFNLIINTCKIIYFNNKNKFIYDEYYNKYSNKINTNKFQIKKITNKIKMTMPIYRHLLIRQTPNHPLSITQYYNNSILNTYQCWFKSAINFFINNGKFIKQIIYREKGINNKMEIISINNVNNDKINNSNINNNIQYNENISSDIINTESINLSQKGGNYDIYELFQTMFFDIENDNYNESYYIQIKRLINEKLNNKYYLGIPGYKLYPYYVIQDLLFLFNDDFTNDCIIEYNNNLKSYIYDCNINYIYNDIKLLHNNNDINKNLNINDLDYKLLCQYKNVQYLSNDEYNHPLSNNLLSTINFKEKNNKYYFEEEITKYIQNIKIYPNNLLIACPIHDLLSIYLLNTKINLPNYDYDMIKLIINNISNKYDIRIFYPYNILFKNIHYYLHSFILLVNNSTVDSHFIYYKINNKDLLRFDTTKHRLNKENIKYHYQFIQDEFNTIYSEKGIKDNLNNKVVFCYYRKINKK